ncbi:hypothetical protein BDV41DRAFT_516486 [Aspergillus transmontanensis]|uniref:Uncharacterized protein n=1 Tax=Aspergillus transmontanensis TaxID=1034304 RepID=A0A5N6WGL5_9EURO|nr:hypothetical protein BDV41DRAFT_516486 [Aspergillus transmontanensis]
MLVSGSKRKFFWSGVTVASFPSPGLSMTDCVQSTRCNDWRRGQRASSSRTPYGIRGTSMQIAEISQHECDLEPSWGMIIDSICD